MELEDILNETSGNEFNNVSEITENDLDKNISKHLDIQNSINENILNTLNNLNNSIDKLNKNVSELSTSKYSKTTADGDYTLDVNEVRDFKGRLLSQERLQDIKVSIYEKDISFTGSNIPMAQDIYYAQQLGLKLRNISAELNGGQLVFDGNKFRSSSGYLKFSKVKLGLSDVFKGFIRKNNAESFFLPSISGVGTLQLKDTVKYLYMVKCSNPRKFILEQGVYAASAGQFKFGVHADTKIGSMIFSGKNILQTTVEGRGILILELPVPPNELVILKVTPDRPVRVNEQEVIYREGNVTRNKKLASGIFGSMATGTGFVEEYTGEGLVVLAPSLNLAEIISSDLKEELEDAVEKNGGNFSLFNSLKNKFNENQEINN